MTFTGRIGSSDSSLGSIVLGYGSSRARRFVRPTETPAYRVQVLDLADTTTTYGIGPLIAEFDRVHTPAYADYANSVPEAYFTIHQDDPKIVALRDKGGRAHVRIWRGSDLVWTGWVSLERDANSDDAIFYCYGYAADLFWLHTDWKATWTSATLQTIISESWTRARTLSRSRLNFVGTGTIESPPTASGGSTAITLQTYEAYRKRLLFLMQEMAALAASDTGNAAMFEITHSTAPVFNFWKDRSRDLTDVKWEWDGSGRGKVQSFREYVMPVYHRNHVYGIGQNPRSAVLQKEASDPADMDTGWGRMEEALFFSWVRDETELDRVMKLRMNKALQHDHQITLSFFPGAEVPPGTAQSKWRIGDTVPVLIDRGVTHFDGRLQVSGYMVYVEDGQEYIRAILQEPL